MWAWILEVAVVRTAEDLWGLSLIKEITSVALFRVHHQSRGSLSIVIKHVDAASTPSRLDNGHRRGVKLRLRILQ